MVIRYVARLVLLLPVLISVGLWLVSSIEQFEVNAFLVSPRGKSGGDLTVKSKFGYWSVEASSYGTRIDLSGDYSASTRLVDRVWSSKLSFECLDSPFGHSVFLQVPHWLSFLISCLPATVWFVKGFKKGRELL